MEAKEIVERSMKTKFLVEDIHKITGKYLEDHDPTDLPAFSIKVALMGASINDKMNKIIEAIDPVIKATEKGLGDGSLEPGNISKILIESLKNN